MDYFEPKTVSEALSLLDQHGDQANPWTTSNPRP